MNDRPDEPAPSETGRATGFTVTPGDYGFAAGAHVGRYVVLDRVGGGGMGVVYAAYDPELDRKVALKLLRPGSSEDDTARKLLLREAQTLARLAHPNVVTVHDVGEIDGHVFLAMEFVAGSTLRDWLRKSTPTWRETLDVFLQAGRGLSAAHAVGIVHRDFKPDNVLVGSDGRVRVADFGIARLAPKNADELPPGADLPVPSSTRRTPGSAAYATAALMGTPPYMAPERLGGRPADARSDQWSFSVALAEALYGAHPFADSSPASLRAGRGEAELPRSARVPGWLRPALLRGLSPERDARFASMDELLGALARDPSITRRRAAVLGAFVVAAVGVGALYARSRAQQAKICDGADARAEAVWNADRKAKLAGAFAAIPGPYARYAWTTLASDLDTRAHEWAVTRTRACRDVLSQRGPSAVADDARLACLDDRVLEMGVTVDELDAVTDPAGAADALVAVQSLPTLASCDRGGSASARPRSTSPAKDHVKAEIARINVLSYFGKHKEGAALAAEAEHDAEAIGDSALISDAYRMGGYERATSGDHDGAEGDSYRAIAYAEKAGDDRARGFVIANLIFIDGFREARWVDAQRWYDDVLAIVARIGGDDALEAEARNHYGLVLKDKRDYDAAAAELTKAVALYERMGSAIDMGAALDNLGGVYKAQAAWGPAENALERSLATTRAALGDHPRVARVLNNIADMWVSQGKYEEALTMARQATQVDEGLGLGDTMDLEEPVETSGEALLELGRYADAIEPLQRCLAIEAAHHASQRWQSETLADIGRTYVGAGQPEKAIEYLERVVQAPDQADAQYLAEARFALARALRALHKDAPRATALARAARDGLDAIPPSPALTRRRSEIEAWLANGP